MNSLGFTQFVNWNIRMKCLESEGSYLMQSGDIIARMVVVILLASALAACNPIGLDDINATPILQNEQAGGDVTAPPGEVATVMRVIDGDTIDVSLGGATYRVRYIGVNTPEVDELCSSEATAANVSLVEGKAVTLVKDVSETDRYDRLLRYVYVGGTFVNAELVRQGWAEAAEYPPDLANAAIFADLEDAARLQNLGCWPSGVFGSP
jgi:endonuclease YncB( thermonuclease family)